MDAATPSPAFAKLFMALGQQPQERTRDELFDALGLDAGDHFLTKIAAADSILRQCGIEIRPRLQDDPPDGIFLLRRKDADIPTETTILDQLAKLESASQEFKSTYWCDFREFSSQVGANGKQLRSESVKQAALKAIAGFLTTGGGTLFIGVDDAGRVLGLRPDLDILKPDHQNVDQLINNIKTDIAQRFRDRNTINDYVSITAIDVRNVQILQLKVASRSKLSFLGPPKRDDNYQLFRRQGNRTTEVKVYEVEEFQAWRSKHVLSV